MQKFLLLAALAVTALCRAQPTPPYVNAENRRSDTFDILKYTIDLEIGSSTTQTIGGVTTVSFATLKNSQSFMRLDLLKLTVDSVTENNQALLFNYNDTILKVQFAAIKNLGDVAELKIYYHGQPQIDGTGWGGFYFNNTQTAQYAYNLGVGFAAKPHNYGRVWFPCFDNFIERSKYTFRITTDSARKAYCGGALTNDIVTGAKRTRTWELEEQIPTYLASVNVAKYTEVKWTASTLTGPKPVVLAALPSDTNATKTGFANLLNCVTGFEHYFGPYRWNRVGYSTVPFNAGAMEHATNIAYPRNSIGSLAFEELMSHELAHHWWGNLVTCETPEDMWINEGMASLSAHLFYEWQYGKKTYMTRIQTEHDKLLRFLHRQEGGFRAISGVPHDLTYSSHVYKKGAEVGHNLRGYMGDSAFFKACKFLMQQKAFNHVNSLDVRDIMQQSSAMNLSNFFTDWVFTGGWSHFSIDSVRFSAGTANNYVAQVRISQKLYGTSTLHQQVPLEISFFKQNRERSIQSATLSGVSGVFTFTLDHLPVSTILNFDGKIADASVIENRMIAAAGLVNLPLVQGAINITDAGPDTSLIRLVHHFVKPDPFHQNTAAHILSDQHYWSVEGVPSTGLKGKARFYYDGTNSMSGFGGTDTTLTRVNGDSLALFYRKDASQNWTWLRHAIKLKVGAKTGYMESDSLYFGEYAFGNLGDTSTLHIAKTKITEKIRIYPNPASHQVVVELTATPRDHEFRLTDSLGRQLLKLTLAQQKTVVDVGLLPKGTFIAEIISAGKTLFSTSLLLN